MAEIYRKSSLERLSSPEQLDKMIKITSPSLWISFIGIIAVVISVIIWAVFGSLPENLRISGVYTDQNSTYYVFSSGTGEIADLYLEVGDTISKGDIIAELYDQNTEIQLTALKKSMSDVNSVTLTSTDDVATNDTASLLEIKVQFDSLDLSYFSAVEQFESCKTAYEEQEQETERLRIEMETAEQKYLNCLSDNSYNVTYYDYQKAQSEYSVASSEYEQAKSEMSQIESVFETLSEEERVYYQAQYDEIQSNLWNAEDNYNNKKSDYEFKESEYQTAYENQSSQSAEEISLSNAFSMASSYYSNAYSTLISLKSQLVSSQLNVELEKSNLNATTLQLQKQFDATKESTISALKEQISQLEEMQEYMTIVSPYNGTVTGMYVQQGQSISQGSQVLKIKQNETDKKDNIILCYVPLESAKKIEVGMKVIATPSTVDEQEYGHMTGKVLSVNEYCTDTQEMLMKLGDELLVNSFQQSGPVIEVIIELDTDTSTANGYAWSNKKGSQLTLTENTMISLKIVVDENPPISKLIPTIKKFLAGETKSEQQ